MLNMTSWLKHAHLLFILACSSISSLTKAENPTPLEKFKNLAQSASGAGIEIHGANNESKLYVGIYIYDNIFNALHVSLLTRDPEIKKTLSTLTRHDNVRVWGNLLDIDSPQPHLNVTRLIVEKRYEFPGGQYHAPVDWASIGKELAQQDEALVEVHTVQDNGSLMVVEYKEHIFPIFTREFKKQAENLNRQDFIRIHYKIQETPHSPIHLELQAGPRGQAIELIDSIHAQHGKIQTLRGALVMFPKSPSIRFNVFAVKVDVGNGFFRTYTLINFEDAELFKNIRSKLQKIWDENETSCRFNDRNKLTNPCVEIEVTGSTNHVDANQANPQILLDKVENIRGPWVTPLPRKAAN